MRMRSRTHLHSVHSACINILCKSVTCTYIFRSLNTKISLKFKTYSQKAWFIKMLLLSPKCSKTHLRASLIRKIFAMVIPRSPLQRRREWAGRKRGRGSGKGRKGEGWEKNRLEGKEREGERREEKGRGRDGRPGGRAPAKFLG
jgi:hypothetical protein